MTAKHPEPDYTLETTLQAQGFTRIAGVDEVGRGPLAGPLVAAAVVLDPAHIPPGINDSKRLSAKRRAALHDALLATADVSIAMATVQEIETHNILRASHIAMIRALAGLARKPDFALIDGNLIPAGLTLPAQAVIKGDARSVSVAAASVMAKLWRDRHMVALGQQHPHYGWDSNAGYPTAQHKLALREHGITIHHRRTFKPIHNILYQDEMGSD